jgi:hypothetical protein
MGEYYMFFWCCGATGAVWLGPYYPFIICVVWVFKHRYTVLGWFEDTVPNYTIFDGLCMSPHTSYKKYYTYWGAVHERYSQ